MYYIRIAAMGPAIAVAAAIGVMPLGSVANDSVTVPRIVPASHGIELPTNKPRGEGTDAETAEDAWAHIPGGPGNGRLSEGTIRRECQEVNGAYATRTTGGNRLSSCAYRDIDGALHTDYYNSGVYSHTEDADGNLEHA